MPKKLILGSIFVLNFFLFAMFALQAEKVISKPVYNFRSTPQLHYWQVQSVDTMKYSRDLSREYLTSESAAQTIDSQIAKIASTGANYVAIGTPYDSEFLPVMRLWVRAARNSNLKVWFRGNWSGWEEWFGYETISSEQLIDNTYNYIFENPDLFEDGDIFTACTECENGQLGDPRHTGKVVEYREFLIKLDSVAKEAFGKINKQAYTNFYSMNGDVARLVMDKPTTAALGGIVTVDHYVASAERLNGDINSLAESSGGKVVLGEVGVAIPDIHGDLTSEEEAAWLDELLSLLSSNSNLVGINYWVSVGGSTALWGSELEDSELGITLTKFYSPVTTAGVVINKRNKPLGEVKVSNGSLTAVTDSWGRFWFPVSPKQVMSFEKSGYSTKKFIMEEDDTNLTILLENN